MFENELCSYEKIVQFVKKTKNEQGNNFKPLVICEKKGEPEVFVTFSNMSNPDKHEVLKIVKIANCIDFDAITVVLDSYMTINQYKDESEYPEGLQKAFLAGNKDITEGISITRFDSCGNLTDSSCHQYKLDKGKVEWTNDCKLDNLATISGFIPETFKKIMLSEDNKLIDNALLQRLTRHMVDYSPERQRFVMVRSMIWYLQSQGYELIDAISMRHPEWCDYETNINDMIEILKKNKVLLSNEKTEELTSFVIEKITEPDFDQEFCTYVYENIYDLLYSEHADKIVESSPNDQLSTLLLFSYSMKEAAFGTNPRFNLSTEELKDIGIPEDIIDKIASLYQSHKTRTPQQGGGFPGWKDML